METASPDQEQRRLIASLASAHVALHKFTSVPPGDVRPIQELIEKIKKDRQDHTQGITGYMRTSECYLDEAKALIPSLTRDSWEKIFSELLIPHVYKTAPGKLEVLYQKTIQDEAKYRLTHALNTAIEALHSYNKNASPSQVIDVYPFFNQNRPIGGLRCTSEQHQALTNEVAKQMQALSSCPQVDGALQQGAGAALFATEPPPPYQGRGPSDTGLFPNRRFEAIALTAPSEHDTQATTNHRKALKNLLLHCGEEETNPKIHCTPMEINGVTFLEDPISLEAIRDPVFAEVRSVDERSADETRSFQVFDKATFNPLPNKTCPLTRGTIIERVDPFAQGDGEDIKAHQARLRKIMSHIKTLANNSPMKTAAQTNEAKNQFEGTINTLNERSSDFCTLNWEGYEYEIEDTEGDDASKLESLVNTTIENRNACIEAYQKALQVTPVIGAEGMTKDEGDAALTQLRTHYAYTQRPLNNAITSAEHKLLESYTEATNALLDKLQELTQSTPALS